MGIQLHSLGIHYHHMEEKLCLILVYENSTFWSDTQWLD